MALVPPAVVTWTCTVCVVSPCGTVTTTWPFVFETGVVTGDPNETDVALARCWPVIVMVLPPLSPPDVGLMEVTTGLASDTVALRPSSRGEVARAGLGKAFQNPYVAPEGCCV